MDIKMIDLKIDLILLSEEKKEEFVQKYNYVSKQTLNTLEVLVNFSDFLYIDDKICDKLLLAINYLKSDEDSIDYSAIISSANSIKMNNTSEKYSRRDSAVRSYYRELNDYVMNNDIDFDRLGDISESIRKVDYLYQDSKLIHKNSSKVIEFLNSVVYKVEHFNVDSNVITLLIRKYDSKMQKVKK